MNLNRKPTPEEVRDWCLRGLNGSDAGLKPKPKIKIFIVRETPVQSWLNDAGTFLMIACVIGLGWFLGSSAMQWVGAIMAFLIMLGWSSRKRDHCTPQEAADRLRREFGVVGREPGVTMDTPYSGPPPGDADFDDMCHALGRPKRPDRDTYRNYYCCETGGETARRFEALGWWDFVRFINSGRDAIYTVNGAGKEALAEWLEKRNA